MVARNPARFLAPIALAATIAGGYLIVSHHVASHPHTAQHATTSTNGSAPRGKYAKDRFYTVKSGDNLTSIAQATGVSINRLEVLNPSVNPNALQTGQRLRLRR